jgi:hypothetical protein
MSGERHISAPLSQQKEPGKSGGYDGEKEEEMSVDE